MKHFCHLFCGFLHEDAKIKTANIIWQATWRNGLLLMCYLFALNINVSNLIKNFQNWDVTKQEPASFEYYRYFLLNLKYELLHSIYYNYNHVTSI